MDETVERRLWLDKLLQFMEDRGTPISACPTISKNPLDLFRLYLYVKERGGFMEVCKVQCSSMVVIFYFIFFLVIKFLFFSFLYQLSCFVIVSYFYLLFCMIFLLIKKNHANICSKSSCLFFIHEKFWYKTKLLLIIYSLWGLFNYNVDSYS